MRSNASRLPIIVGALLCMAAFFYVNGRRSATTGAPATTAPVAPTETARDPRWAVPMSLPGLPNCFQVSDTLYRGAQPTAEGMRELKRLGIKTIVNLRTLHSDRDEMKDAAFDYEHIYFNPLNAEDDEIVRFLALVQDPSRQPVFVHCAHGADRTGTMCAMYRIFVEDWSKEDAVTEMTDGGYGFHKIYQNLLEYILALDADRIRQEVQKALAKPVVQPH